MRRTRITLDDDQDGAVIVEQLRRTDRRLG